MRLTSHNATHSAVMGLCSGRIRSSAPSLRCMPSAVQQLTRPLLRHAAGPRWPARTAVRVTAIGGGDATTSGSYTGSGSTTGKNSNTHDQHNSTAASNAPGSAETTGWNASDYNGSASAWGVSNSAWPTDADWGNTVNLGDWGESPSVSQSYSNGYTQQTQTQQYTEDAAPGPADAAAGSTVGGAADYAAGTAGSYSSNSNSNSSYSYGASGYQEQDQFASTAAGTFYGSSEPNTSSSRDSYSGNGYYSSSYQQQDMASSWPFADATSTQQPPQQPPQQERFQGSPGPLLPSDITLIGRRDADSMLPLAPNVEQARYYQPRTLSERLVQIMGSFGVSVVLSKSAVLAGPALLYPVWGPWIRAGIRNVQMYLRQFKCVGLWRAQVIAVQINTIPYAYRQAAPAAPGDSVTITVGDPWQGGARTELTFPYQAGCEDIVEGEPAELLVLCQDDVFTNFKVVREVYLPQSGMWLSEYPFVDRDVFLDVSLAIERGRQAATAPEGAAAAGGYQPYDRYQVPYQGFTPAAAAAAAGAGAAAAYGAAADTAAAAAAGFGSFAGGWAMPNASSSAGVTAADTAGSGRNSSGYEGYGPAAATAAGAMFDNGNAAEAPPASSSNGRYSYPTDYANGSQTTSSAPEASYSAHSSSSTPAASTSSSSIGYGVDPGSLIDEFAGVASQVGAVASQVTGAATHVAADVASGVAAGLSAGLGWVNTSAAPNSSTSSSSSDSAVVPDVIIEGAWSPMGGYLNRSGYGPSSYPYSAGTWPGQQPMGAYGQPYVDQGFTGVYQRDAAGFGTGRYAGPTYSQPSPAAPGVEGTNGYSTGATGAAAPGYGGASYYGAQPYSSFGTAGAQGASRQGSAGAQGAAEWQSQQGTEQSGPGVRSTVSDQKAQI